MSSPIDTIIDEIKILKKEREELYERFAEIEINLKAKQVIMDAFLLVSKNASLYDAWKSQVILTERPSEIVPEIVPEINIMNPQ